MSSKIIGFEHLMSSDDPDASYEDRVLALLGGLKTEVKALRAEVSHLRDEVDAAHEREDRLKEKLAEYMVKILKHMDDVSAGVSQDVSEQVETVEEEAPSKPVAEKKPSKSAPKKKKKPAPKKETGSGAKMHGIIVGKASKSYTVAFSGGLGASIMTSKWTMGDLPLGWSGDIELPSGIVPEKAIKMNAFVQYHNGSNIFAQWRDHKGKIWLNGILNPDDAIQGETCELLVLPWFAKSAGFPLD